MRKAMSVIGLAASLVLGGTVLVAQTQSQTPDQNASARHSKVKPAIAPLNVNTGLWQMTQTVTWTGLPPQFAAALTNGVPHQYKSCVKQSDLLKNPWANGSGEKCSWTVLNSNGTDMEVQGTCAVSDVSGMSLQMHGKIHAVDSQDGTGSVDVTLNGNGMNAKGHADYTGKWIGATCPAGMN